MEGSASFFSPLEQVGRAPVEAVVSIAEVASLHRPPLLDSKLVPEQKRRPQVALAEVHEEEVREQLLLSVWQLALPPLPCKSQR